MRSPHILQIFRALLLQAGNIQLKEITDIIGVKITQRIKKSVDMILRYQLYAFKRLEEALAYEKGTAKAATIVRKRSLPDVDAAAERKTLGLTQKVFAKILGVSPRTVEAWESGDPILRPRRGTFCT